MDLSDNHKRILMTALKQSGVFVTSGYEHPNIMSTHWGAIGRFWNKQVFILPVRPSKMSHHLIDEHKSFTISVPIKDMRNEIILCDHLSGYHTDKFEALHLHPQRTKNIQTFALAECGLILECKVIFAADMTKEQVDEELVHEMYEYKDFHTLYFAEVVDAYEN